MLAILSPAKTLDFDSPLVTDQHSAPEFTKDSAALIKTLRKLEPADIGSLMGISDKLATLNHDRYAQWSAKFDENSGARASILAFKGDVYLGLSAQTMSKQDFTWAQKRLRVLSGLHGLLRPLDRIHPYRLEMGTALANARGKDLYQFWGGKVTQALNETLAEQRSKVLINLASNEYYKVVQPENIDGRIVTINFKEWRREAYRFVSFSAKKARGLMARYMIDQRAEKADDLKTFNVEGYAYNEELSSEHEWIFTRSIA
ncbi:MAG: peroxide stress protein YaaA [Gammaproteobacteria bacterium]|nr:peroxide stress protein YaaA [Gammaproteobacteria bacterium]HBW99692.1 peroxide stress protein YaaA [Gammaproteobacteria bacterium]